ncbi:MAG: TerB family tellurite resistance protein [Pseudomonadota bacterium]
MLDRLKQLFQPDTTAEPPGSHSFDALQLAAAALMVEAATMDAEFNETERDRISQLVEDRFALSPEEAIDLIAEAQTMAAESVAWQGFTNAIKNGFDHDERVQLIEMLWEVVYADGQLHDYEASLLRRVTGLLYVTDRESGDARKRVLARHGLS